MWEEEFYSGFCKTINDTRRICCEFRVEDGKYLFDNSDCEYEGCHFREECLVIRQALEREQ